MNMRQLWKRFALSRQSRCCRLANPRQVFDSYSVGFSTPAGNQIWVQDASFDGKWGVPPAVWPAVGKKQGLPRVSSTNLCRTWLHIQWLQEERNLVYTANVQLPDDLGDRARKLPGYTVISTGRHFKDDPILIIGMKPDGQVTIWLSNVGGAANVKGRVLDVVGRPRRKVGRGQGRRWTPTAKTSRNEVRFERSKIRVGCAHPTAGGFAFSVLSAQKRAAKACGVGPTQPPE